MEREALRISARYVLGLSASARGFAPWMTPAGVNDGPNAGAVVSGHNFYHFCALYLLQHYVFCKLFKPEQPFSAH